MSPRDLPLWARGVAVALMLVASWWLWGTETLRGIIGDSIGMLALAVVSISILRGMHLPLNLWPSGPWRSGFSARVVLGTAVLFAILIVVSSLGGSEALVAHLDVGMAVLVIAGAVGWGFALTFVEQRRYIPWYGVAVILSLIPFLVGMVFVPTGESSNSGGYCMFAHAFNGADDSEPILQCQAGAIPSLLFLFVTGVGAKLVTEEVAFRRMLIGSPRRAGLLSVIAASLAALAWYALMVVAVDGHTGLIILGVMGAFVAGCLYVLSRSLLVSGMFSAGFAACSLALTLSQAIDSGGVAPVPERPAVWITTLLIGIVLAIAVTRRNGFAGDLLERGSTDVTSD